MFLTSGTLSLRHCHHNSLSPATYVSNLRGSPKKLKGLWPTNAEVKDPQDLHLHPSDLSGGVGRVSHIHKICDLRGIHLLIFRGNEHGSHTNKLEMHFWYWVVLPGKRISKRVQKGRFWIVWGSGSEAKTKML